MNLFLEDENFQSTKKSDFPKQNMFQKIILCYSIYSNTKAIFLAPVSNKSDDSLPCIHGIKVWGMFYIILLHTVLFQTTFTDNAYSAYRLAAMFPNQILSNSTYSVDTFFCLGWVKYYRKNPSVQIFFITFSWYYILINFVYNCCKFIFYQFLLYRFKKKVSQKAILNKK